MGGRSVVNVQFPRRGVVVKRRLYNTAPSGDGGGVGELTTEGGFNVSPLAFGTARSCAVSANFLSTLATSSLLIFRNILTGLREVPEEVRESARGMGLSSRQILWRVELPLALPAIVAGLRVAVVTVISLATVAAFVVDEGLGAPIFQSISSPFNTAFIAAGALAVLLALAADALLVGAQRLLTPWAVRQ